LDDPLERRFGRQAIVDQQLNGGDRPGIGSIEI